MQINIRFLLLILVLISTQVQAQIKYASTDPKYINAVQQADSAMAEKEYQKAFALLEQALAITDKSQRTLLRHAEAAVQLSNYDAAFASLSKAQNRNWQNFCAYCADQIELYKPIENDSRWKSLMELCAAKESSFTANLDRPLMDTLSRMRDRDGFFRNVYEEVISATGANSKELKDAKKRQAKLDEDNVKQLKAIISQNGFPTISKVALYSVQSALIVVQRASTSYRRQLLPSLQVLAQKDEIRKPDLAVYIDNLLYDEGKPQVYGTRIDMRSAKKATLYRIAQANKVDSLRLTMNLGSEKAYLEKLGLGNLWPIIKK